MKKIVLIFMVFLLMLLFGVSYSETWSFKIVANIDQTNNLDSYICSGTTYENTNFGTGTSSQVGFSGASIMKHWSAFRALSDSLALLKYTGVVDSGIFAYYRSVVNIEDGKTVQFNVDAVKAIPVETEITYNIYSTGNNWGTPGAGASSDTAYNSKPNKSYTSTTPALARDSIVIDGSLIEAGYEDFIFVGRSRDNTAEGRISIRTTEYNVGSMGIILYVFGHSYNPPLPEENSIMRSGYRLKGN